MKLVKDPPGRGFEVHTAAFLRNIRVDLTLNQKLWYAGRQAIVGI